jgi:hypothetical protein
MKENKYHPTNVSSLQYALNPYSSTFDKSKVQPLEPEISPSIAVARFADCWMLYDEVNIRGRYHKLPEA